MMGVSEKDTHEQNGECCWPDPRGLETGDMVNTRPGDKIPDGGLDTPKDQHGGVVAKDTASGETYQTA